MRDRLFEINHVFIGPRGNEFIYGRPYRPHRITVSNREQAYKFANEVATRLVAQDHFKVAKVAYVRDLSTGRFV